jgi:hypothetical protein
MPRSTRLRLSVLLAATATAVSGSLLPAAAGAADPPWTMVASGLDNPRLLSFDSTGALYVAEAGTGGPHRDGACLTGAEGGEVCFGRTGAISRIAHGMTRRVVRKLPSLAGPDGSAAIGPSDVQVRGDHFAVSIGLAQDPAARKQLPRAARFMATLSTGTFGMRGLTIAADLGAYEAAHNPDGVVPDTDPVGFQRHGSGYMIADAGGNDILRVGNHGAITTEAVFASRTVPDPFAPPPATVDMQAVPTSVVRGPDGAWYVSQLTGFPFPTGAAQIFRVVPGQTPTVYASGFTNITDLAWRGDTLYAVELSTAGLLNEPGLPSGALVKAVPGGDPVTVVDNLPAPYGVAIRAGSAYVTTCAVCANGGGVARVPLS